MSDFEAELADIFAGHERVSSAELRRRAVSADVAADVVAALDRLPEGEYALDEAADALDQVAEPVASVVVGVAPDELSTDDLLRELGHLHETRNATFRHGSAHALDEHTTRTDALEAEYLRRFPAREVDDRRTRSGAREQ
jgi:hypothetical protein